MTNHPFRQALVSAATVLLLVFAPGVSLSQAQPISPAPQLAPGGRAMIIAGQELLASFTPEQRKRAVRPLDDPQRFQWHYWPKDKRKGVALFDMTDAQRLQAMQLLRASLSPDGSAKAATVLQQEEIIRHFEKNGPIRDPLRYYVTFFGEPKASGQWGLSIEGHHLSCNFLITDGQVVSATPYFIGANPAEVKENGGVGPTTGTRILRREEEGVLELIGSLTPAQLARVRVSDSTPQDMKEGHNAQTETTTEPQGLVAAEFNDEQKKILLSVLESVVGQVPAEYARPRLELLRRELDQTRFAWYGDTRPGQPFSCRIEGPSVLVLLFKAQADSSGNPANHTHLLWRTPGRDFGE